MEGTNRIIECVPNFSEGRNMQVIHQIAAEIEKVESVKLLNVDPGKATNRTVMTFVGPPEAVCEAAFMSVKKASELIDMRRHQGEHPRFGATDVCPLIPIQGITMDEVIQYVHLLAKRVGQELGIPVYCYEYAAKEAARKNLASCREGEYEGLRNKIAQPLWMPDYGPTLWNDRIAASGATAIGARNFLVAYNINLNTTSVRKANAVAFDIREKGRPKREGNLPDGKKVFDAQGEPVYEPGLLKAVKAIGWYIKEYGIAQISINLTNLSLSPLHKVFETTCERAAARGMRVTGSELVGMIPLSALTDAGKYYLHKQNRSSGIPEEEIIRIAVKSLGLDDLSPFDPDKKILEYRMRENTPEKLTHRPFYQFLNETASESPAPGGGSVSACVGAFGAALAAMVANLSANKSGWENQWKDFSDLADIGIRIQQDLLTLVDEDTNAFNRLMETLALPRNTEADMIVRKSALENATLHAAEIPLQVMKKACELFPILKTLAEKGSPAAVSDAGVGAICIRSAILGAFLNVKINAASLQDKTIAGAITQEGLALEAQALVQEKEILEIVGRKISPP
jgi:glutamate formiminotransferase/formiminotetrahydrofolate cyclodeaminase